MKKAFFNYTGYGKTKIVLDYIQAHPEIKRVLIISTAKIISESWPNEINKWSFPFTYTYITGKVTGKKREERILGAYDILGITPSLLHWFSENKHYQITKKIIKYDLVVFDESDMFKNSQTKRFKNVKKWIASVPNVFIMTATPMPNTIEDLWSQIYLIDEEPYRLGKNITAFRKKYGEEIIISTSTGKRNYEYYYLPAAVNAIMNEIAPIAEVNLVKPIGIFPEPKIRIIKIEPDEETKNILNDLKQDYVVEIENQIIATQNYQRAITKLQQIGNGFIYNSVGEVIYLNDIKIRYIKKLMSETLDPILVTYSFIPDKERLLKIPGAKLIESEEEWNNNQIKLGVVYNNVAGLNLQHSRCKNIIWYSPTWDARAWEQTNSRVIRKGLKHKVTINVLIVKGSIEDLIYERMRDKLSFMRTTFRPLEGTK